MSCGIQSRSPGSSLLKLWREFGVLNENLAECVKHAEAYFLDLDAKVNSTKSYFLDIKSRISSISKGDVVMTKELNRLLQLGESEVHEYFLSMRSLAQEDYHKETEERTEWMRETSRLMDRQRDIISALEKRMLDDGEVSRLRNRMDKTFQNIAHVEGEVKGLQKVLFDCEVGRTELEEDFILLVKSYRELARTIEQANALDTASSSQKNET